MTKIDIGKDYKRYVGGREDGRKFRKAFLEEALLNGRVEVYLDSVVSYGDGFLQGAFGELISDEFSVSDFHERVILVTERGAMLRTIQFLLGLAVGTESNEFVVKEFGDINTNILKGFKETRAFVGTELNLECGCVCRVGIRCNIDVLPRALRNLIADKEGKSLINLRRYGRVHWTVDSSYSCDPSHARLTAEWWPVE